MIKPPSRRETGSLLSNGGEERYGVCLAPAAVTKYERPSGFNSGYSFPMVLESRKSDIKVLADLVPGEDPHPGLQITNHLLALYVGKRERALVSLC